MKFFKASLLISSIFVGFSVRSQDKTDISKLPVEIVEPKKQGPDVMVLYLTGDGGWNNFSQKLSNEFASAGAPVVALNSLKYFWSRKTPEQAALDVTALVHEYDSRWKKKAILLCGYSFGAEVMPFIYNLLSSDIKERVSRILLLSPSAYTDFEVHVSYLFLSKKKSVASEVLKISKPVICYYGMGENDKSLKGIQLPNFKTILLKGDHHYENSTAEIVEAGIK